MLMSYLVPQYFLNIDSNFHMTSAIVVDASDNCCSPLNSPNLSLRRRNVSKRSCISEDYRRYEVLMLILTQLSYFPIAATMLSTSFYEPSHKMCSLSNDTCLKRGGDLLETEFHSILVDWGEACCDSPIVASLSTTLMVGALVGAFVAGWIADAYGRRPVVIGSLMVICAGNIMLAFLASISRIFSALVLFLLGIGCGGYMVTNLVLLVECLEQPRSRLLAVSLNGWSFSMIFVAVLARSSLHWFFFHLYTAIAALSSSIAFYVWTVESCRWLASVQRISESRSAAIFVAKINRSTVTTDALWWEIVGFSAPILSSTVESKSEMSKRYRYVDLFRHSSITRPLLALCYCFVVSSVVSFGFYFNVDALPGDRYSNMALMGFSKFLMGIIPFIVSNCVGRRPIVLFSVGIACLGAWLATFSQFTGTSSTHWSLAVLSLIVASSLDPTWKINHLYSAELFPTVIRNMARGICNVGARLGSVAAPSIVHLRSVHYLIPYVIFSSLLSAQWLVVAAFLPETKDTQLPEVFPVIKEAAEAVSESVEMENPDSFRSPARG